MTTSDAALTPGAVLVAARTADAALRRAEAEMLAVALQWGLLHPSSDGTGTAPDAAVLTEQGECEPIAGPGCPGVSEYSVAEFATALGVGGGAAKVLIGHALELSHRLPRLWSRVLDGEVSVAQARSVAETTIQAAPALTMEAADWVDQRIAPMVGQASTGQVQETLAEAVRQFGLAVEDDAAPRADRRGVQVTPLEEPYSGLARVEGLIDLADALDLDQALETGADELAAFGASSDTGPRRAAVLGHLARRQTAIDLGGAPARRVDLSLHFSAVLGPDGRAQISPTGTLVDERVLLEQVRGWVSTSHTEVHVHPVRAEHRSATTGESMGCDFPWCDEPRRSERQPQEDPDLCGLHLDVLEHGWDVDDLGRGRRAWRSPSGAVYLHDRRSGTRVPEPEGCTDG